MEAHEGERRRTRLQKGVGAERARREGRYLGGREDDQCADDDVEAAVRGKVPPLLRLLLEGEEHDDRRGEAAHGPEVGVRFVARLSISAECAEGRQQAADEHGVGDG